MAASGWRKRQILQLDTKNVYLKLEYETADRITIDNLKDSLAYLEKEQKWFEADEKKRTDLEKKWGHTMWVHPEDYAKNVKLIYSMREVLAYYGGF